MSTSVKAIILSAAVLAATGCSSDPYAHLPPDERERCTMVAKSCDLSPYWTDAQWHRKAIQEHECRKKQGCEQDHYYK